jgi:hypothetical protein
MAKKQYKYVCNKCGTITHLENKNEDIICYIPVTHRTSGLCLGKYKIEPSDNVKAIREFFHIIANYMKLIRMD